MSSNLSEKKNQNRVSNEKNGTLADSLNEQQKQPSLKPQINSYDELLELRRLIIQPEEVGDVLPSAVEGRTKKDNKLTEATLPLVEENIRQSVLRDPKILAEALFPVIGPSIRKAISEALSSMVQNLNQTLEHSISPKSLRWRIEALKTGKSFGEVVMLKTLLYRVEQVFLIHKKTGLLLQHVAANPNDTEDADMVSAMLTAITDFVHDSFKTSDDATLDSLKINELTVWLESGPDAILAVVIRGNPPLSLRETFDEAIEKIQYQQEIELDNFDGDTKVFNASRPVLEDCLRFQTNQDKSKNSGFFRPASIFASVLVLLLFVGGFFYVRDYLHWTGYLKHLRSEKGIVVTEADRGWFRHSVGGLRDSLAADPSELLLEYSYENDDIEQNWKFYQDSSSEFILKRANKYLHPPEGVTLKLENQTLIAEGKVSATWFNESNKFIPILFGVDDFKMTDGLDEIVFKIESNNLFFECNTVNLKAGQVEKLDELAKNIEQLINLDSKSKLETHGFANSTGSASSNYGISKKRAEVIINELENRSEKIKSLQQLNPKFINIVVEGNNSHSEECKVTFKIKPQ